jgi:hypothetical protein
VRRTLPAVVLALPLAAGVFALACAAGAEAALPAPPFTLDVSPSRVAAGQPVQLSITRRGGAGAWDLYLMWAFSPEAAFLAPDGTWSPRPVAFRARLPATGAPITLRWVPSPPREVPLALVVVPAGGDPLARFAWTFRPVIARVDARPPAAHAPRDVATLAALAVVTLLACALVVLTGRPFRH